MADDTATPVGDDFTITWSFSSLSTYETCPRKYWAEKVAQVVPWGTNEAAEWGSYVHECLENYVRDRTPLPDNVAHYKPLADKVVGLTEAMEGAQVFVEEKLAVNERGEAVPFDDPSAFGRGIADVLILYPNGVAVVVDYKTGKYRGPTAQAPINAWLVFKNYPQITEVKTAFIYIKMKYTDRQTFTRENVREPMSNVLGTVERLRMSVENENFPATKNGLCRNYCGYTGCLHNGNYSG